MLATLNSRQIVDEIVKDTVKDNDPHDAVQISPEMVLASRPTGAAPALAPEIASRPEPKTNKINKIDVKFTPEPARAQPTINVVYEKPAAVAPPVDAAVRVTASDGHVGPKRSAAGKWLRGAFVTFLFAGGSAAATIAWEQHGDTAKQMLAEWTPALASLLPSSLLPSTSQTAPAAAQAAPPAAEAATDPAVVPSATPPAAQAVTAPAATPADATQSVQSMTRDLAAMALQIETLRASIAELKAGQEQMAREMAKPPAPKPVVEAKPPIDPRARVSALPPRPAPPPMRKPKPAVSQTYMPAYPPTQLAPPPPPSQATAVPPVAPVATTQAVADDDGPVVRPPMPVH